ncbi:MAG: FAD-dependent oxidoreductase, partial [Thermoanaerobaculia bacterium]|nr:FAD-dependent oxidoreductase [Thermoanaerobaculia bacterium]
TTGPRVVVVGAGAFGGWIALELLRRGARVTLVDAWGPGNSRASSGGEGRAIRAIYGPDEIYVRMVRRAFELWAELEAACEEPIYHETGALWLLPGDDGYVSAAVPLLERHGFPVERPSLDEARRRYPQIDFEGISAAVLERRAGVLSARRACRLVRDRFVAAGGAYRTGRAPGGPIDGERLGALRLEEGPELEADRFVFACGPWLGRLFPDVVGEAVRPSRQEVYYFGTPAGSALYGPGRLPIWIDFDRRIYYGFPDTHGRGFKIADDTRGEPVDPTSLDRRPTGEGVEAARAFLRRRFPGLADAPLLETRVCQYENSPDGDLIADRHPGAADVWLVGGGSGHGFKLSPALGELVAEAVLADGPAEPRFRLGRLRGEGAPTTQFERDGS